MNRGEREPPTLTGAAEGKYYPGIRDEEGGCILGSWQGGQGRRNVTRKTEQQAAPPA